MIRTPLLLLTSLLFFIVCGKRADKATTSGKAYQWLEEAAAQYQKANYDSAFCCLDKAVGAAPGNDTILLYATVERANYLVMNGRMAEALPSSKKAIEMAKKLDDHEALINMYSTAGILYRRMGDTDSALIAYKNGVNIAKDVNEKDYVANLLNNIGILYAHTNRYDEASSYFKQAEKWAVATGDTIEQFGTLANISAMKVKQGKYAEAIAIMEPLFGQIMKAGNVPIALKCAAPLLNAYVCAGRTHDAAKAMKQLRPLMDKNGQVSNATMGLRETEAKLLHAQKRYEEELDVWNSIDSLNSTNQATSPQKVLAAKARCFFLLGMTNKAYPLMEKAFTISDSLKNSDVEKQLSEFSIRYKTKQKELEVSRLTQEKAEQHSQLMTIIMSLSVICAVALITIITFVYRRRTVKQKQELAMHRRFIEGIETERARLARELHDGTCNELLHLSMKLNQENSQSLNDLRAIRNNVRRISHELMPPRFDEIDISELLHDYLTHYPIEDCAISYQAQENVNWKLVPHDVAYDLYRITQEIMGNIARHSHPSYIKVNLQLDKHAIILAAENDGTNVNSIDEHSGIGAHTLNDRLKNVGGTATQHSQNGSFTINITIPFRQ